MSMTKLFIGLAALIVVVAAWTFYSGNGVPWHELQGAQQQSRNRQGDRRRQGQQQEDPEGDPADWTEEELKAWLENVS